MRIDLSDAKDIVDKHVSGNRHTWHAQESGLYCLTRTQHAKLYSIEVWKNGGHLTLFDGTGRAIFRFPSCFTGSFQLDGYSEQGLYARVGAGAGICPHITISFMELPGA